MMLKTPLGEVTIYFDGELVDFKCLPIKDAWEGVEHTYYLEYDYIADNAAHTLKCILNNDSIKSGPETGERFESIAFYGDTVKMNIGTKGSFGDFEDYGYDYDGHLLLRTIKGIEHDAENGVEIHILKETSSKTFIFGVAWQVNYTDENDHFSSYAAEPPHPREIK